MFSEVVSIRPGRRMLPIGFQTLSKTNGSKNLAALDKKIAEIVAKDENEPTLISVEDAVAVLQLAYANLEFEDPGDDDRKAHLAALEHLSRTSRHPDLQGKVWLLTATDRNVARYREEGRFSDSPDNKRQADLLGFKVDDVPALILFRQNGEVAKGWRDLPFWWPVIVTPKSAVTSIFATDIPTVL